MEFGHGTQAPQIERPEREVRAGEKAAPPSWGLLSNQFQLLVETVRDYAIFLLDTEGNIRTWNAGAERIKGWTAAEIIGQHFSRFYTEEDVQARKPQHKLEIAAEEGRAEDEGWRVRKDGSRFWANVILTALRDEGGRLVGFAKVTRDFTERMEAQEALRREIEEKNHAQKKLADSERSLRKLSLHLLRSQDEERRRIGRDLHDSLGQNLALLKMKLDVLGRGDGGPQQEGVKETVNECRQIASDAIKEVRTISYLLYPPMLEEMGLRSAITWYLEGFTKRSAIQTTFESDAAVGRLPREAELAMFRVLQEALINVHRHSQSPVARIRLFRQDGHAVLEVQDAGTGIARIEEGAQDWLGALGVGVRGMSERIQQLGGTLEIQSSGEGTKLTASVPYGDSGSASA